MCSPPPPPYKKYINQIYICNTIHIKLSTAFQKHSVTKVNISQEFLKFIELMSLNQSLTDFVTKNVRRNDQDKNPLEFS